MNINVLILPATIRETVIMDFTEILFSSVTPQQGISPIIIFCDTIRFDVPGPGYTINWEI